MKNKAVIFVAVIFSAILFSLNAVCQPVLTAQKEITYDGKSLAQYAQSTNFPEIEGKYAYAINLDTGIVVYGKDFNTRTSPANTVKLMTAIVAYENIEDLDTVITASSSAVSKAQGANMAIKTGESFTARELLYGLLVRGANDAALVLAEYVAGTEQEFCSLMNQKALELGAVNTHFENVTGFYTEGSYTTARDVGIIAQYMYYIPTLFDISNTTRYVISPTEITKEQRTLINRNMLLSKVLSEDYYYSRAKGMSQGSTPEGGHCIVSCTTGKTGLTYICVVLASKEENDKNYACIDMRNLLEYCETNFDFVSVTSGSDIVCEIPVKNAIDVDHLALFPEREIQVLLPIDADLTKEITKEIRLFSDTAYSPVNKSDVFGEIVIKYRDEATVGTVNIVSNVVVDRSNVLYFFSRIENMVMGTWFKVFAITAAVLFALYFGLSVYYRYFKRNKYTGSRINRK
ncbi:MAG: D-alanyl-D-alanine carboxypeptidase [Clostridia bacterium]|nr:D-alanyl-D-alanine carboxypeptidase [Clostridia bacterium]